MDGATALIWSSDKGCSERSTGDCGAIDWTFLGLSMPWWSLIWFALLALWVLVAAFARR